jgi:hypothetical protein
MGNKSGINPGTEKEMKLLTKENIKNLKAQDPYDPSSGLNGRELSTEETKVPVKFFDPTGSWTWYCISASEDPDTHDIQFYGLVDGHDREFGYFWLSELQKIKCGYGLGIERDLYWNENTPLTEVMATAHSEIW